MTRRELFGAMSVTALTLASNGFAQTKASAPVVPNKEVLADEDVKQLLLLMDTDKNGKISKQEWMGFMSAEFDRLDTDQSGELDPKELTQSRLSVAHPSPEVQGK
jgi:Ca2+-binding EF-hand superfamily protein